MPRLRIAPCTFAAVALAALFSAPAIAQPVKKVLVIGIDGLRPDCMELADCSNIDSLIAEGAYSNNCQTEDLTFSGPSWSAILHGVHRDRSGVDSNDGSRPHNLAQYPDFLSRIEQWNPALHTFRISDWDFIRFAMPTSADHDLFINYTANGDELLTQQAAQILAGTHPTIHDDPDVVFFYYADVDVVGHTYRFAPDSPQYLAEIEQVDEQLGRLLAAIRGRATYSNEHWLCVVVSDHGGLGTGHAGNLPIQRRTPMVVSGPLAARGVIWPGPKNVDVLPTVLTYFGAPIDPMWGYDGRAVGLTPSAPPAFSMGVNLIFNGDAEYDRGFGSLYFDQYCAGWDDPGPSQMTIGQWGAPGGWPIMTDPGPAARGRNLFIGGTNDSNAMNQVIDVSPASSDIDALACRYTLSGWLGGFAAQADHAIVRAEFLSQNAQVLGVDQIGPVTPQDRADVTGLVHRSTMRKIPVGARAVRITLESVRVSGSASDGYADNLSLIVDLGDAPPPPPPPGGGGTGIRGTQWDFDNAASGLDATFGPGTMSFWDPGNTGQPAANTRFGTTASFTLPPLSNREAGVIRIPPYPSSAQGLLVDTHAPGNGDGVYVNQWTIVADVLVRSQDTTGRTRMPFFNTNNTNSNDADGFLNLTDRSLGHQDTIGFSDANRFALNRWQRIAWVFDLAFGASPSVVIFVNGQPVHSSTFAGHEGRWALYSTTDGDSAAPMHVFSDDNGQTCAVFVNSLYFVDRALAPSEVAGLGEPDADGPFGSCPADFDGDGFVTGLDFDVFVAAFEAADPRADYDDDGFVTGLDFDEYVGDFEAGC